MKLIVCISKKQYSEYMIKYLGNLGYRVTKLASTGGFLKQGNDTLLIVVHDDRIEELRSEMQKSVLELEKEKGWSSNEKRYTSFIIKGEDLLPILNNGK